MVGSVIIKDKRFVPLITEESIAAAVTRMAEKINAELSDDCPVFLVVLNGSFMFAADLLRQVRIPCEISFVKLSSYSGTRSTGTVKDVLGLEEDVSGRMVVILEDIVDSGLTVEALSARLRDRRVKDLRVATLLFKPSRFSGKVRPEYIGFEVADDFVVGYGMDYEGQGRNLKEVHVLA